MPFISSVDRQSFFQEALPYQYREDANAFDTISAAFGHHLDEEAMISSELNNEVYHTRREIVKKLINDRVINRVDYQKGLVGIDYDKISADLKGTEYEGMVFSNEEARQIRNQILKNRREERLDIMDRGSGFAQFVGTAGAAMLDPINFVGLGAGLALTTAKSLTTMGRALYGLRTEAAIAGATETAIQPFVFAHKEDIDSPYSAQQAATNIAFAAGFAGALGGAFGGAAGYLYKARTRGREVYINNLPADFKFKVNVEGKTLELGKDDLQPFFDELKTVNGEMIVARQARDDYVEGQYDAFDIDAISSEELISRIQDGEPVVAFNKLRERSNQIEGILNAAAKAHGGERLGIALESIKKSFEVIEGVRSHRKGDPLEIFWKEYQKWFDGRVATKKEAAQKAIEKKKKEIERIEKENDRITKWVTDRGGLNMDAFEKELGIVLRETDRTGLPSKLFRVGDEGLTPDGLKEALREDPTLAFEYRIDPNRPDEDIDVTSWVESMLANNRDRVSPEANAQIADINRIIEEIESSDFNENVLDQLYDRANEARIDADNDALNKLLELEEIANQPSRTPEMYDPPDSELLDLEETNINITEMERQVLQEQGLSESHDQIMARYEQLSDEEKAIRVGDDDKSVADMISDYEKELEFVENLVRCTRNA